MTSGFPTIFTANNSGVSVSNKLRLSDVEQYNSASSIPNASSTASNKIGQQNTQQTQQTETNAHFERAQVNKPPPQFIIKRVNTQDLYDDHPIRQSNLIGLSAINEENTGDIDEVMQMPLNADFNDPNFSPSKYNEEATHNIFKAEMVHSTKYKEFQKGPIIRDGQIVKHSILGSVETFEKYIRINKKFAKENTNAFPIGTVASIVNGSPSERGSFSDISVAGKIKHQASQSPRQDRNNNNNNNAGSQHDQSSISSSERATSKGSSIVGKRFATVAEKKRAMKTDLTLNKDQVMAEIHQIRERQKEEENREANKHRGKTLNDKNVLTKDERVLQKHNNVNYQWQKTVDTLNTKVGREGAKSVMLASDDFRQKKEMAEILDIIKTDEERYGSKYWYKTLRKVELKSNSNNFNSVSAVPSSLRAATSGSIGLGSVNRPLTAKALMGNDTGRVMKTDDERPASMVEYIRKPRLIQTPAEATRKIEQFPGRTEREYVSSKMSSRKQILKEIRPMETEGLGELIVQGKNKLGLEAGAMLGMLKGKDSVSVPKNFYTRHTPAQPEEIIEKNMDKVTIMKGGLGTVMF